MNAYSDSICESQNSHSLQDPEEAEATTYRARRSALFSSSAFICAICGPYLFFCELPRTYGQVAQPPGRTIAIPVSNAAFGSQPNATGTCIITAGPLAPLSAVAFSPDGHTVAVGGYREILLWDLNAASFKRIGQNELGGAVHALAFRKGGAQLAAGEGSPGRSGAVRIFDVATGKTAANFRESKDVIYSLAFSPDGKLLATGGIDPAVRIWNVDQQSVAATLKEARERVLGVAFSSDGSHLATVGADAFARIYETAKWKPLLQLPQPDAAHSIVFAPTDDTISVSLAGETEHGVRIQHINYPEPDAEATPAPALSGTSLSAKSGTAAPVATGTTAPFVTGTAGATPGPATSGSAQKLSSTAPKAAAKPAVVPPRMLDTGAGIPWMAAWQLTGKNQKFYVPCSDKCIRVYSSYGTLLATWTGHDDCVYSVALSPDGRRAVSAGGDGTVKLWNTESGRLLATLVQVSPRSDAWAIVTPQGTYCGSTGTALQWKSADGKTPDASKIAPLQDTEAVRRALAAVPPPMPAKPKPKPVPLNSSPAPKASGTATAKP